MSFIKKIFHKEENCLNCNYPLIGQYCANCGQKAFLHKDSFWHMASHFAGDYFHYDNKFWTTLKTLFTRPGLATLEYIHGKRAKYLNPIQLYIFVTTIFFILFFATESQEDIISFKQKKTKSTMNASLGLDTLDSIGHLPIPEDLDTIIQLPQSDSIKEDTTSSNPGDFRFHYSTVTGFSTPNYATFEEYDSVQKKLAPNIRHNFLSRFLIKRVYQINKKYKNVTELKSAFVNKLSSNAPKIFFVLLPLFAFLLKIIFRRNKLYYVDHIIFSIHFHAVIFILFGISFLILKITLDYDLSYMMNTIIFFGIGFYLFVALKRVFNSSFLKTLMKQFILTFLYFIGFIITSLLLIFVTILFI